ncbi:hypothetical protein CDAR_536691 [Caerostris darwini]|uniref:Uncharacterized protein n=1 Tax=Caerostris darwini TaxID=1538125 RepID=A0AAV4VIP1_9ARAC|nr:hypothetical protein CDAR_536691 [Caerostris darwini]
MGQPYQFSSSLTKLIGSTCRSNVDLPTNLLIRFRRTTAHNYLQAHVHRIGLASDGIYPLCRIANMDGDHLPNCTELIDVPDDINCMLLGGLASYG